MTLYQNWGKYPDTGGGGGQHKNGGLRCGHNQKEGGVVCGYNPEIGNLELVL